MPAVDVAPVFSEYKWAFAVRRLSETWLGGPRVFLVGGEVVRVPVRLLATQAALFAAPVAAGAACLAWRGAVLHDAARAAVFGALLAVYTVAVKLGVRRVLRRARKAATSGGGKADAENVLYGGGALCDEEPVDTSTDEGWCRFLFDCETSLYRCAIRAALAFTLGLVTMVSALATPDPALRALVWPAVGMAMYGLAVRSPIELAQWKPGTEDMFGTMRATHVVLFSLAGGLRLSWAMVLLPILWAIGLVPALEVIAEWFVEQVLLHVFGGTASASSARLVTHGARTALAFGVAWGALEILPIEASLAVGVAAPGALLSQDVLLCLVPSGWKNKGVLPSAPQERRVHIDGRALGRPRWHKWALTGMICVSALCGALAPLPWLAAVCAAMALAVLAALVEVVRMRKRPFFCGAVRNHASCAALGWRGISALEHVLRGACVLVLCSVSAHHERAMIASSQGLARALVCAALLRAVRVATTSPTAASAELLAALVLEEATSGLGGVLAGSTAVRMLVAGWIGGRIRGTARRIHFAWVHVNTASRNKKLRLRPALERVAKLLLPTGDIVAAFVAAVLDAPLVPIVGTPIFVVGFPRPMRLWPWPSETCGSSLDATYYLQVYPRLVQVLAGQWREGSLRLSRFGDTMLLVRFEKMIAWVCFLEAEYGHATVYIKGLELQEPTSCHSVESNALDTLVEASFAPEKSERMSPERVGQSACSCIATDPAAPVAGIVEPVVRAEVQSYSHSSVSLRGVIDNPDFLRLVDRAFMHALVWSLARRDQEPQTVAAPRVGFEHQHLGGADSAAGFPEAWATYCLARSTGVSAESAAATAAGATTAELRERGAEGPTGPMGDDFDLDALLDEIEDEDFLTPKPSRPVPTANTGDGSGIEFDALDRLEDSLTTPAADAPSSDDEGGDDGAAVSISKDKSSPEIPGPKPRGAMEVEEDDNLDALDALDDFEVSSPAKFEGFMGVSGMLARAMDDTDAQTKSALNDKSKARRNSNSSDNSDASVLNMLEVVLEPGQHQQEQHQQHQQHQHQQQPVRNTPQAQEQRQQPGRLRSLALYLHAVVSRFGLYGQAVEHAGAVHVFDCFQGKLPHSHEAEWLREHPELEALLVSSYRAGFKLALDAFLLGDPDASLHDLEAVHESLGSYAREWFVGGSSDAGWEHALRRECPHLVSLQQHKPGVYGVLQLSLQRESVAVCLLQAEMARGLWAALSTELFYFTNDDDERYSIQAHPVLLRNLVVQAADPPLGYPVFAGTPARLGR